VVEQYTPIEDIHMDGIVHAMPYPFCCSWVLFQFNLCYWKM